MPGYAWTRCTLGATFYITQKKKGYYSAEVRLSKWKAGSTLTLHWGGVDVGFRSIWHGLAISSDPFAEWAHGGDWPIKLSAPDKVCCRAPTQPSGSHSQAARSDPTTP